MSASYAYPVFAIAENQFTLLWLILAYRMHQLTGRTQRKSILPTVLFLAGFGIVLATAVFIYWRPYAGTVLDSAFVFPIYKLIYGSAFALLISVLLFAWRLEAFWRSIDRGERWRYRYLVLGLAFVCVMLGWSSSYRLAFLRLPAEHLLLLALTTTISFGGLGFVLARYRRDNDDRAVFKPNIAYKLLSAVYDPMVIIRNSGTLNRGCI